jgi:signal transduction histidine kinase/CheY-like chemotaxis protein
VLGWLRDDERFKLPVTPIERLDSVPDQSWVHLVGEVWSEEAGRGFTLRDGTGQVVITTVQPMTLAEHASVEVVGRPARDDFGWTLQDPLFRPRRGEAGDVLAPDQAPQRLRLAEQVVSLTPEEAAKHQMVSLRGVITWFDERAPYFFLQDASGGVRIRREPGPANGLLPGASVALSGVTVRGSPAPEVDFREVAPIGPLGLPPARSLTLDQALAGAETFRRVEMRGFVRQIGREGYWTRLDLITRTGDFVAYLPAGESLSYLQGAMVRLRGVCVVTADSRHTVSGAELWLQDPTAITVDEAPAREPFNLPAKTTAELRRLASLPGAPQRVRFVGMVLLTDASGTVYAQDREGGVPILSHDHVVMSPGSWIEVAGIPGRAGNRLALRATAWRPTLPGGPAIEPREIRDPQQLDAAVDAQLARVTAVLRQTVREQGRVRLTLESDGMIFEARMPAAANWPPPEPGSRLALTGVYLLEFDDYRQPRSFRLEMRTPADVTVLATPPWWTVQRTIYVAGLLGLGSLAILVWVVALRRRVRQQTEQIRAQMAKETALQTEVERAARLESLGVLAGGIAHDFNNLLTAILGNLGLAAMDKRVMAAAGDCISEAERGARRARDITHQLLTFAKGGEPVRTAVLLPEIVTEAANFARHGSNVRLDISCPPDLPAGDVDAGQISRVVHNLVLNAVEAMPAGGMVSIKLAGVDVKAGEIGTLAAGRYIRLSVTDTGHGIPPEILSRIFDPYFSSKPKNRNSGLGLATVRSIIVKHNGHIEVDSKVGSGTTFRLWLPAALEEAPLPPKSTHASALEPARVLVMDDEAVIRRVAGRMLALAGHETVFAADGAEAMRAYIAARQSGAPFDFVILDLTVPGGMGGKEALAELLKIDAGIRAIASSGYSNDPVMANPKAYGFRSRLPKPYDIPDLIRAIEESRGS